MSKTFRTATQWGVYDVLVEDEQIRAVTGIDIDPAPSAIGQTLTDAVQHKLRIRRPAIRKGWLENPGERDRTKRGTQTFVELPWDEAFDIAASEIERVVSAHDNKAIFGGSYGWASAGRFNHAQSQLHRFLNLIGGSTRQMNSYSTAAAQVILPHVVAPWAQMELLQTSWAHIAEHAQLVVTFGGLPAKNAQVAYGGITEHQTVPAMRLAAQRGVKFITVSPIQNDSPEFLDSRWLACRPGTDVAFMLGIAHTLASEGLSDESFLATHTVGYDAFHDYLTGTRDGIVKSAAWASEICGLAEEAITALAREMAACRTFINAAWSLQRADHGEQPYWMVVTLAAMLGDIGKLGGGFGFGYSAEGFIGSSWRRFNWATLSKGRNPTQFAIPVARIADMLLNPGESVRYDGQNIEYPHTELIYWAGGNPFHHHQDLNRLLKAWQVPATVIVNEPWWTPVARYADIVFPTTTALERQDICASSHDPYAHVMQQVLPPQYHSRTDHQIFAGLAERLGVGEAFTENRSEIGWLRHMWDASRTRAGNAGFELPDFDSFWAAGLHKIPDPEPSGDWLAEFRADPQGHPLSTPSGKIEIFSATIAEFDYEDCPGHPCWLEPFERIGGRMSDRYPLHLVSNQPAHRLHSQLDHSSHSRKHKISDREIMRIHPEAAAARGITDGMTVRLFNDRGACLAGARLDERLMPEVVELPTGAWFNPLEPGVPGSLELAGNPNVLTRDKGTSSLAQGPSANTCLVEVEPFAGSAPLPTVYDPPELVARDNLAT